MTRTQRQTTSGHHRPAGVRGLTSAGRDTLKIIESNVQINSVAFSPDRRRIVTAGHDKPVQLSDADTGQLIGEPMSGHLDAVAAVAFSRDGRRIVSGSWDRTVRVWPTPPRATWPGLLCSKLTANLSHQQWRDWVSPGIDYITVCPDLPIAPD
jgi:WD40 repeat protein